MCMHASEAFVNGAANKGRGKSGEDEDLGMINTLLSGASVEPGERTARERQAERERRGYQARRISKRSRRSEQSQRSQGTAPEAVERCLVR